MFYSADIHTVTEFNRKPAEHIRRLNASKQPEILNVNGKAALVVQDAERFTTSSTVKKDIVDI